MHKHSSSLTNRHTSSYLSAHACTDIAVSGIPCSTFRRPSCICTYAFSYACIRTPRLSAAYSKARLLRRTASTYGPRPTVPDVPIAPWDARQSKHAHNAKLLQGRCGTGAGDHLRHHNCTSNAYRYYPYGTLFVHCTAVLTFQLTFVDTTFPQGFPRSPRPAIGFTLST